MHKQVGTKYQHVKIDHEMEELKQNHVIAVLKFRNKLYVGTHDQHGQEDLLVYCFDNDNEMLKFNEFARECYNEYKSEVKQC